MKERKRKFMIILKGDYKISYEIWIRHRLESK